MCSESLSHNVLIHRLSLQEWKRKVHGRQKIKWLFTRLWYNATNHITINHSVQNIFIHNATFKLSLCSNFYLTSCLTLKWQRDKKEKKIGRHQHQTSDIRDSKKTERGLHSILLHFFTHFHLYIFTKTSYMWTSKSFYGILARPIRSFGIKYV